jgi:hypothetical protein
MVLNHRFSLCSGASGETYENGLWKKWYQRVLRRPFKNQKSKFLIIKLSKITRKPVRWPQIYFSLEMFMLPYSKITQFIKILLRTFCCLFVCFGFYVTSTQYRSYRDVPALLVEEDLRCPSVHYFRHERAPE